MIFVTVFVVSCAKEQSGQQLVILYADKVNALINMPIKHFGNSRSSVQAKLGAPSNVKTEPFTNWHNPEQIDYIHTLHYPGLDIMLYDVAAYQKEFLISVRMTKNYPDLFPTLIGKNKKNIESMLGPPHIRDVTVFKYFQQMDVESLIDGEDEVKIEFQNSIVKAVQWYFYID
jgi:hypothetical protein